MAGKHVICLNYCQSAAIVRLYLVVLLLQSTIPSVCHCTFNIVYYNIMVFFRQPCPDAHAHMYTTHT